MFEKLLEKLLLTYFGTYVNGIDPNNLHVGIWSGDIKIESVSLNEEKLNAMLTAMRLPLKIKFSSLGSLRIIVPWNKLSSQPVDITVTDVVLCLELDTRALVSEVKDFVEAKKTLVLNYCRHMLQQFLGKAATESEPGYVNKMLGRIIDNIQLNIGNIHIRLEGGQQGELEYRLDSAGSESEEEEEAAPDYGRNKPFACGFCLKGILAYTTDANWERRFVDRSSEKVLTQIRKKVELQDISVYWQEKNVVNFNALNSLDKRMLMLEIIKRKERRLLSVSGLIKFVRNSQTDKPLYCLSTDLEFLKVELNYLQLKDIINLASLIGQYQDSEKQFKKLEASQTEQLKLQPEFVQEFTSAYESEFKEVSQAMSSIILRVDRQLLIAWTKQCMKAVIKRQRIEQVEKEKNKRRWYNFMAGAQQKITESEEREIDDFVESLLTKDQERGADMQWLRLDLVIVRGNISIMHTQIKKLAHFQYSGIEFGLQCTKDYHRLVVGLKVGRVDLKYVEYEGKAEQIDRVLSSKKQRTTQIDIIKPSSDGTLLDLEIDKVGKNTKVVLRTQALEINHDIEVTTFVKELMELRASEEVKSAAWNRVVQLQQQRQEQSNNKPHQNYQIDATVRAVVLSVMLTKRATLKIGFNQILAKQTNQKETSGAVKGVYILYRELVDGQQHVDHHLLSNLTVRAALQTHQGTSLAIDVDPVEMKIKDNHIAGLMEFADRQSKMFKTIEQARRIKSEENSYRKGILRLMTVFKTWKEYYAVFVGGYIEFYEDESQTPQVELYVKGCKIIKGDNTRQIRLEGRYTNELIECQDDADCNEWASTLQQRILDMSSNEQLFRRADEQKPQVSQPLQKQLDHSKVVIHLSRLAAQLKIEGLGYQLVVEEVRVVLLQSKFHFERHIEIACLQFDDLSKLVSSDFRGLVSNGLDTGKSQRRPVVIKLEGRKKLHPAYTGELSIEATLDELKVNFDPAFYLRLARMFLLPAVSSASMSPSERENVILEMAHRLLTSSLFSRVEQTIQNSSRIADKEVYFSFSEYKALHSCIALLKLRAKMQKVRMNFIHNTTGCCNGSLQAGNLTAEVNNGNGFLFLRVTAEQAALYDMSNYPRTINTLANESEIVRYALLESKPENSHLSFNFTTFEDRKFINSERLTTFIGVDIDHYTVRYQQQPFMRFIDYLTNQLLGFIMGPDTLDNYDRPPNKEFKFSPFIQATHKEVEGMLRGLLMPFFPYMQFRLKNIEVEFNSHPRMECLRIFAREILITNRSSTSTDRTEPIPQQITRFSRKPYFAVLTANEYFRDRILKSCWVQSYSIGLTDAVLVGNSQPFSLQIEFERLPGQERGLLFPFLRQRKTLELLGNIPRLSIRLDRRYYNLLNKCLIHNLTYDDEREQFFQHNFKHQRHMQFSDMSNIIKIDRLQVQLVELEQTLTMGGFEFWFMRDVKMVKRMFVKSKHMALTEKGQALVVGDVLEDPLEYQFEFTFESQPNFDKKMTVELQRLKIQPELASFMKIGGFVVLDADCFPPSTVVSDLPAIVCNVHAKNCKIVLVQNDNHCYYASGDIGYIWLRNRFTNHDLLKEQHQQKKCGDEHGIYTSNVVFLRGLELTKCLTTDVLINPSQAGRDRFRKLSGPIVAFVRINHILKFNPRHEIYYDTRMEYSIENAKVVLSYADISELMAGNQKKQGSEVGKQAVPAAPPAPPAPAAAANPAVTSHILIISNLELQVLLSSPPAPVMLLQLTECKAQVKQWTAGTNIQCRLAPRLQYWNLKVGKWQPILQDTQLNVELKLGSTRQLLIECRENLMLNVSVECVRLIKSLLNDISTHNQSNDKRLSSSARSYEQNPAERRRQEDQMERTSPYIIYNNLGCDLQVESDDVQLRKVLRSSQQVSYNMNSQQDSYRSNQPKRVKLTIREEHTLNEIGQIDLDRVKNKVLRVEDAERSYDIIFVAEYQQITKRITISSAYIIHNLTEHPMVISYSDSHLEVGVGEKVPLPYNIHFEETTFQLNFPHLGHIKENFKFESKRMIPNYEHYIVAENGSFNCNVECEEDPSTKLTIITVTPLFVFRNSLPCELTLQVVWQQNGSNRLAEVKLPSQSEKGFHEFGSRDAVSVKAAIKGFHLSQMTKIYDPVDKAYRLDKLTLSDYRGNLGALSIKYSRKHRVKKYTFYSNGFLINQTPYSLYCYDGGRLIPGQRLQDAPESYSKVVVMDTLRQISLSLGENEPSCNYSSNLELKVLGNCGVDLLRENQLHELAVFISVECVDHAEELYSTVVQVWPRYILINKCSRQLHVRQCLGTKITKVAPEGRVTVEFENRQKAHLIQMRVDDPDLEWMFSEALNFKDSSTSIISFSCRGVHDYSLKKCFKLEIVKEFQYYYLLVQEINDPADALIRIENGLKYVRLNVYQAVVNSLNPVWLHQKKLEVREGNAVQYALDYPNLSKKLVVELSFVGPLRSDFDDDRIEVDLGRQFLNQEIQRHNNQTNRRYSMKMQLETIGPKAILKFLQRDQQLQDEQEEQQVTLHLAISFKQLGLALVGDNGKQRCELIFLSIKQFGLIVLEKKDMRTIQLKIKCISIENNSNHNTSNPVTLTPWKEQENIRSPRPFLVFLVEQGLKHKSITEIRSMRMCLQPTSIRIDDEFIERLYNFVKMIGSASGAAIEQVDLAALVNNNPGFAWQVCELKNIQSETFIQELQIAKISLSISFSMRPRDSSSNMFIYHILNSLGVALSKISESPITFSHIILHSKNINQIKKHLAESYWGQFKRGIIRVIGSINLIGNPYSLGRYFVDGLVEVVDNPVQGFIKGPIEGTFGIITGSVGLVRNVVAGCSNSFELISDSMSSGLSSLTMDQQFIERREKIKNHESRNVFSGLLYGGYSVYTGVQLALTGLYRQPVEGYRSSGVLGGVAGSLKAVSGLVTKPLSGLFEGISKTSEGIKNTALMFQDGPRTQRERQPRVFYGQEFHYGNYNALHSDCIAILEGASTRFLNLVVLAIETFESEDSLPRVLVVSNQWLCLVDLQKKKLEWDIASNRLSSVRLTIENIILQTKEGDRVLMPSQNQDLYEKLNMLLYLNSSAPAEDD